MALRLWVAIDVPTVSEANALIEALHPHRDIKIGMELFYRAGPVYVAELAQRGYNIFLDLKCHDIPRTTARAVAAVRDLGVELLTVHGAGGFDMMDSARQSAGTMQLVAVSALTSLDDRALGDLGLPITVEVLVRGTAAAAQRAGLAGLVASAGEVAFLREMWPGARLVVPGIRLPGDPSGDQRRVFTPAQARQAGATDLVVGRAIAGAEQPREVLKRYWDDFHSGAEGEQHGEYV